MLCDIVGICFVCNKAGFLPGIINILSGFSCITGAAISSYIDIDKIAFTGSTVAGCIFIRVAADSNLKKVILELGRKLPNIIFNNTNSDKAIL